MPQNINVKNLLTIRRPNLDRWLILHRGCISEKLLFSRERVGYGLMFFGVLISMFATIGVWFFWPIQSNFSFFAIVPIALSWVISKNTGDSLYCPNSSRYAAIVFFAFQIYSAIVNKNNINFLVGGLLSSLIIFSVFSLKPEVRTRLARQFSVLMGCILIVSIPTWLLFVIGFPLPSFTIEPPNGLYTFDNYFFFLSGDNEFEIMPRFQSIFLEPGHVGTMCALMLFTQVGNWRKWYNILMIVALLLSFSLAAYVLFVIIIFTSMWMKGKRIFLKLLSVAVLIVGVGIGSYFYNDGDNLVNQLILARLEMDDTGKLAGDNRVTPQFEGQYDDFIKSDDILFGRDYNIDKVGFGNSGYRVFIYNYGLVGVLLMVVFYLMMPVCSHWRRSVISMWILTIAIFWERATPNILYNIIPLFIAACWEPPHKVLKEEDPVENLRKEATDGC
ncbi:MAG: hypothetical protein SPE56_06965 [Prevotella sp.]|nr:hypothetical protein [Prevotella sp.]